MEDEELPDDFIRCVEKLLSSISTLIKHLSRDNFDETKDKQDIITKLQVSQMTFFINEKDNDRRQH